MAKKYLHNLDLDGNALIGASGAIGETGATGPQGPTGPQGATGAQGFTGIQGASGVAGTQGATGPTGNTGVQGVTGPTGPTGPTGLSGIEGATGASGSQGETGLDGATGAQGPTGPQGATGPQGSTGVVGATGSSGSPFPRDIVVLVSDYETSITVKDDVVIIPVPASLNGKNILSVQGFLVVPSSSGTPTIQLVRYHEGSPVDVLSTSLTIDVSEYSSYTAAVPSVVNTSNDLLSTGDFLSVNIDVAGTNAKGLSVVITVGD